MWDLKLEEIRGSSEKAHRQATGQQLHHSIGSHASFVAILCHFILSFASNVL